MSSTRQASRLLSALIAGRWQILAPARATGLGGSFAAYAEGVDAIAANAGAVALDPGMFQYGSLFAGSRR